jgi:hypothetical protein
LGTDVDPKIFKVLSAVGDASTAPCAGVEFDVGIPDMRTGEVMLSPPPMTTVTLGSVSGGVNLSCQINVTLRVFQVPTNPAPGPAVTTHPLVRAQLKGVNSGLFAPANGSTLIQVEKATPDLVSTSDPNTDLVAPGTAAGDTATVIKAPGAIAPTGSVRFILCQPSEVTLPIGCPSGTGTRVGTDEPLVNKSAVSARTTDTLDLGVYCWRARYLGDDNYNPQNHTDPTRECFRVE